LKGRESFFSGEKKNCLFSGPLLFKGRDRVGMGIEREFSESGFTQNACKKSSKDVLRALFASAFHSGQKLGP